ncbi:hypothetical protein MRX96_011399 [Rhipicephalus microplus]
MAKNTRCKFAFRRLTQQSSVTASWNKEGLTLMFGYGRFHQNLWGRKFRAVTGHKPVLRLLGPDKAVNPCRNYLEWYDGP